MRLPPAQGVKRGSEVTWTRLCPQCIFLVASYTCFSSSPNLSFFICKTEVIIPVTQLFVDNVFVIDECKTNPPAMQWLPRASAVLGPGTGEQKPCALTGALEEVAGGRWLGGLISKASSFTWLGPSGSRDSLHGLRRRVPWDRGTGTGASPFPAWPRSLGHPFAAFCWLEAGPSCQPTAGG